MTLRNVHGSRADSYRCCDDESVHMWDSLRYHRGIYVNQFIQPVQYNNNNVSVYKALSF